MNKIEETEKALSTFRFYDCDISDDTGDITIYSSSEANGREDVLTITGEGDLQEWIENENAKSSDPYPDVSKGTSGYDHFYLCYKQYRIEQAATALNQVF